MRLRGRFRLRWSRNPDRHGSADRSLKFNLKLDWSRPMKASKFQQAGKLLVAAAAPIALIGTCAAMNGGTALTASAFDTVVTTLQSMLSSSWTIMLALIVLVVAVWQLAHGGGYKTVGLIIGVLALALVGPGFLTTISTSMPTAAQMQLIAQAQHAVLVAAPERILLAR
jgi:hypothetical protein